MTTYNGEKYVIQQLDSLRKQTRPVDELIISDDGSTDSTVEICQNYIRKYELYNWHFYVNNKNNGWIYNFHRCIEKQKGDYIFFCDQDDVWSDQKVERMIDILDRNSDISVLCCGVNLVDSEGKSIQKKMNLPFVSNNTGKLYKYSANRRLTYSIFPGCTMLVRNELIELMKEFTEKWEIPHDSYYWKAGVLMNKAAFLDEALICYRIHGNNASNPIASTAHRVKSIESRVNEVILFKTNMEYFRSIFSKLDSFEIDKKRCLIILNDIVEYEDKRELFLRGTGSTFMYILKYYKYYQSWKMLIGDLLCRLRNV
ncbi:glycosyltransferase family 2 protein [Faecalibaculum rodentium]|nr:glycosyltransferase family 2 protein [Faecalibaculum rodentium]